MSTQIESSTTANDDMYFKTELCRSYSSGKCPYRAQCRFAHGESELRPSTLPPNYKTKTCKNFEKEGRCTYGARCHFIHAVEEIDNNANAIAGGADHLPRFDQEQNFDCDKPSSSSLALARNSPSGNDTEKMSRRSRKNRALSVPDVKRILVVGDNANSSGSRPVAPASTGPKPRYLAAVVGPTDRQEGQPENDDEDAMVISTPSSSRTTSSISSSQSPLSPATPTRRKNVTFCTMEPAHIQIALLADAVSEAAAAIEHQFAAKTQPVSTRRLAQAQVAQAQAKSEFSGSRRLSSGPPPGFSPIMTAPHTTPYADTRMITAEMDELNAFLLDAAASRAAASTNFFSPVFSPLDNALARWSLTAAVDNTTTNFGAYENVIDFL